MCRGIKPIKPVGDYSVPSEGVIYQHDHVAIISCGYTIVELRF